MQVLYLIMSFAFIQAAPTSSLSSHHSSVKFLYKVLGDSTVYNSVDNPLALNVVYVELWNASDANNNVRCVDRKIWPAFLSVIFPYDDTLFPCAEYFARASSLRFYARPLPRRCVVDDFAATYDAELSDCQHVAPPAIDFPGQPIGPLALYVSTCVIAASPGYPWMTQILAVLIVGGLCGSVICAILQVRDELQLVLLILLSGVIHYLCLMMGVFLVRLGKWIYFYATRGTGVSLFWSFLLGLVLIVMYIFLLVPVISIPVVVTVTLAKEQARTPIFRQLYRYIDNISIGNIRRLMYRPLPQVEMP